MAPIAVGNDIPDGTLSFINHKNKVEDLSIHSLAMGKKLEACSWLCGKADELKTKGVAEIICISVNDVYVMNTWGKTFTENKDLKFLSDAMGKYTQASGLELDLTEAGLGVRSRRFALLVDNLKVKVANIEEGGEFTVS